jgi:RNA polymerase sigma factor (sigma-70 family)
MSGNDEHSADERAAARELEWWELTRIARRFARLWSNNVADAEDIAQDAILALFQQATRVRDPLAWLFTVTRHIAARRHILRQRLPIAPDVLPTGCSALQDDRPGVAVALRLVRADPRLSPRDRVVLSLMALGYTHREIAARIGCSRSDIGQYLSRALNRLGEFPATPARSSPDCPDTNGGESGCQQTTFSGHPSSTSAADARLRLAPKSARRRRGRGGAKSRDDLRTCPRVSAWHLEALGDAVAAMVTPVQKTVAAGRGLLGPVGLRLELPVLLRGSVRCDTDEFCDTSASSCSAAQCWPGGRPFSRLVGTTAFPLPGTWATRTMAKKCRASTRTNGTAARHSAICVGLLPVIT